MRTISLFFHHSSSFFLHILYVAFTKQAVFEHDFAQAVELLPGTWSEADLAVITDPSEVPVVVPPVTFPEEDGLYVTPAPEFATDLTATTTVQVWC